MDGCSCSTGQGSRSAYCKIKNLSVLDSMVVVTSSDRHRSRGPNTRRSLINFMSLYVYMLNLFNVGISVKHCVETMWERYSKVIYGVCLHSVSCRRKESEGVELV